MNPTMYKFESLQFESFEEMCETLLNQANEQILRLDRGKINNTVENRNFAKWRLMHLERTFDGCVPVEYKEIYNSLWSQYYRLEHCCNYRHPYLKHLLMVLNSK